jgi:hypothetical protein
LFAKYDFIDYKYGATICGITSQQQRYRLHAQHISSTASFYQNSLQNNCENGTIIGTNHVLNNIFSITTIGDSVINTNK